jgi:hypothetical protein
VVELETSSRQVNPVMEALRYLMSPERKKSRTDDEFVDTPESGEEEMYEASAIEIDEESDDEQPQWARRQEQRMVEHFTKLMTSSFQAVKQDIDEVKQQVSHAVTTANEAMQTTQVLSNKVSEIEKKNVSMEILDQKIQDAIAKIQVAIDHTPIRTHHIPVQPRRINDDDTAEKMTRTMVVGGFMQDSERSEVIALIEKHIIDEFDDTVDEIYAYGFGSIGFVRFKTAVSMRDFLKKFGAKPKPQVEGKNLWATVSRSPEERKKAKHMGKYKRVLIEVGLAKSEDIRIDYRRGILMVKRVRAAEWRGEGENGYVHIDEENFKKVGIDVGKTALQKAVEELLSE